VRNWSVRTWPAARNSGGRGALWTWSLKGENCAHYWGAGAFSTSMASCSRWGNKAPLRGSLPDPAGFKVLRTDTIEFHQPETWGIPALSNGRLFVSENDGEDSKLHCYALGEVQTK